MAVELKDFVAQSIRQVIEGVAEAQEHAKDSKARVNPRGTRITEGSVKWDSKDSSYSLHHGGYLEFDIAVTTLESDKAEGGFGIFVGPLAAGTKGQTLEAETAVSRLRFSVPVFLPEQ